MTRASIFPIGMFALGLGFLILSCVRAHGDAIPDHAAFMLGYSHTDPAFDRNGLAGGVFLTWQDAGDKTPVTFGVYEGSFGKPAAVLNVGYDLATWSIDGLEGALTPFVGLSYYPGHGDKFQTRIGHTDLALTAGISLRQEVADGFGLWASVSPTGGRHVVVAGGFMMEIPR